MMVTENPDEPSDPQGLPDALHGLRNCLSVIRSGCLLVEDALGRGATEEIQPLIEAMRSSTSEAMSLTRLIPDLAKAAPHDRESGRKVDEE